jgi:hypothetical protein
MLWHSHGPQTIQVPIKTGLQASISDLSPIGDVIFWDFSSGSAFQPMTTNRYRSMVLRLRQGYQNMSLNRGAIPIFPLGEIRNLREEQATVKRAETCPTGRTTANMIQTIERLRCDPSR